MKKQRNHYTPEEKVAILRRHLLEKVPISELCDNNGLQPTVFYRWQKEFFEYGAAAFQPKARPNHSAEQERIDYLLKKIQTKDEVLAELMAEHVALKRVARHHRHPATSGWRIGRSRPYRLPSEEPAGRLPAADVHDAGRRHCGGEPDQRLAGAGTSGTVIELGRKAVEEGHGLRAASGRSSALAHRRVVHQY
jgi:transposase